MAERKILYRSLAVVAVAAIVGVVAALGTSCGSDSSTKIFPPMVAPTEAATGPAASPAPTAALKDSETITGHGLVAPDPNFRDALQEARLSTRGWKTDFSRHIVPFTEILSGGPPRDGIPPIDQPKN